MHDHAHSTTDTFEHGALHLVLLDYEKRIMQFKLKYSAMLRAVLHINDNRYNPTYATNDNIIRTSFNC